MPLSDEKKKLIMDRGIPTALNKRLDELEGLLKDKEAEIEVATAEHEIAAAAYTADSKSMPKKMAAKATNNVIQSKTNERGMLSEQVQEIRSPKAAFEAFLDDFDVMTGDGLEDWCDNEDKRQLDAMIARQEAALQAAKDKRTALG